MVHTTNATYINLNVSLNLALNCIETEVGYEAKDVSDGWFEPGEMGTMNGEDGETFDPELTVDQLIILGLSAEVTGSDGYKRLIQFMVNKDKEMWTVPQLFDLVDTMKEFRQLVEGKSGKFYLWSENIDSYLNLTFVVNE